MGHNTGKYCIIRSDRAGVFAGIVKERNGSEVIMSQAKTQAEQDLTALLLARMRDATPEEMQQLVRDKPA